MILVLPFLSIAIGFSWAGCALTFKAQPEMSRIHLALATASASIFISAIGLAFSDHQLWAGMAAVGAGAAFAWIAGRQLSLMWSLLISAVAFAAYIHGTFD